MCISPYACYLALQEEDYRLYTVYHLKKLKVLDGSGIEASEQTLAKNKYAGRLTMDMLESKVRAIRFLLPTSASACCLARFAM